MARERRPSIFGENNLAFRIEKIAPGEKNNGRYKAIVSEVVKGGGKYSIIKLRPEKIKCLPILIDQLITLITNPQAVFPHSIFVEDLGKFRDKEGSFSYGRLVITAKSRSEVEIKCDPKSQDTRFQALGMNIRGSQYGYTSGEGGDEKVLTSPIPALKDLKAYLESEFQYCEKKYRNEGGGASDGGDNGGGQQQQQAPPNTGGGENFNDDIPF
jgi:hypothetical protein